MDEALAILREHAPEGLDAGFEHNPVASDSLRYVLERSPAECADALQAYLHSEHTSTPSISPLRAYLHSKHTSTPSISLP